MGKVLSYNHDSVSTVEFNELDYSCTALRKYVNEGFAITNEQLRDEVAEMEALKKRVAEIAPPNAKSVLDVSVAALHKYVNEAFAIANKQLRDQAVVLDRLDHSALGDRAFFLAEMGALQKEMADLKKTVILLFDKVILAA